MPPVDESMSDFMKIDISVSCGKSPFFAALLLLTNSETGFQPSWGDFDIDFSFTIV